MAIKLVVGYQSLQASVKTQQATLAAEVSEASTPSLLNFVNLNLAVDNLNLYADILLDSDTKNIYFTGSNPNVAILSISEQDVISFSKSVNDTLAISETIDIKFIASSKSVLNTAALNTGALN
jgi:hypothetical protein